jgi:hypothetical protein
MPMTAAQLSARSTKKLCRQVAELDRIDTAVLAASKFGVQLPTSAVIFTALNDASNTSAEVIDAHGAGQIPTDVRNELLQLQSSVIGLIASLRLYCVLGDPMKSTTRLPTLTHHHFDPSQLH